MSYARMRPPLIFFYFFYSPSPRSPGADGPHRGRRHVGRHCPYRNKTWCGCIHVLLRYRSKIAKMHKFPIDSYSNENFISPFSVSCGPLTPERGEDTFGTRIRPHAKLGLSRPAGCLVEKSLTEQTNKQNIQ